MMATPQSDKSTFNIDQIFVFAIDLFVMCLVVAPFAAVVLVVIGFSSVGLWILAIWFLACVVAVLIWLFGINFSL